MTPITEAHMIQLIFGVVATALIGTLGFFLKRTLNEVSGIRGDFLKEVDKLYLRLDRMTKEVEVSFNTICHERQGSCSMLMQERLLRLEKQIEAVYSKYKSLEDRRRVRWSKQSEINSKILIHTNGGKK